MDLQSKTIIVTGAARIGQEVAKMLKTRGVNLVMTYFNSPDEIGGLGHAIKADVAKYEDVLHVVQEAKKKFGRVDCVIHMAAIYEESRWEHISEKHWNKNMDVIAKSAFHVGVIAGNEMLKNEGEVKGKMIFFSDWSVLTRPYKDYLAYNVAKSAVVGLTKSLAKELAPGILVNAIAPGPILKPPQLTEEENTEVLSHTLVKRWGGAEEIAKGVAYLLDSDFITGQVLTIDGGRTVA